jgi:hypothetical protein
MLGVMAAIWVFLMWLFSDEKVSLIATVVIGFLVIGYAGIWNWATSYSNDRTVVCNVTSKDRGGSEGGSYRVYTDNCGQLANEDDWFNYKTDSADVWQRIPDHGPVRLHIVGIRFGLTSTFPNILDAQPVG